MQTRSQSKRQKALEQECLRHKELFLRLVQESKSALKELGSALNQRNQVLDQQNNDLIRQLQDEKATLEREREQHMQLKTKAKKAFRRKKEHGDRIQQELLEQRSECESQRQRADRLQQTVNRTAGAQKQAEATLREQVEKLQQRVREQQATFSQASTRFLRQERQASVNHEQQRVAIHRLEEQLLDQRASFDQERARLQEQTMSALGTHADLRASLERAMPSLRGLLAAFDLYERRTSTTPQHASSIQDQSAPAYTQTTTPNQCRNYQQSSFGPERVQALEQANDSLATYRVASRQSLADREAVLVCPISLDLFENPVVTGCCGKTFSSASLVQALNVSRLCPFCRSSEVSTHANRDMAMLVELHRAERSILGLPEASVPSPAVLRAGNAAEVIVRSPDAPERRGQRNRQSTGGSRARQNRHQEQRSQRVHERSAVPRRRSSTAGVQSTSIPTVTQENAASSVESAETLRQARISSLRSRQTSAGGERVMPGEVSTISPSSAPIASDSRTAPQVVE